jgi:Synaptobrevin
LRSLQDPHQADKLAKIQSDLDETKVVLHRTIESMLERGEKLDTLVGKSEDLSMASQMFYKQVGGCTACKRLAAALVVSWPERNYVTACPSCSGIALTRLCTL